MTMPEIGKGDIEIVIIKKDIIGITTPYHGDRHKKAVLKKLSDTRKEIEGNKEGLKVMLRFHAACEFCGTPCQIDLETGTIFDIKREV